MPHVITMNPICPIVEWTRPPLTSARPSISVVPTTTVAAPTYKGIRVTPNAYTTLGEIDRFREAMLEAARHGIG